MYLHYYYNRDLGPFKMLTDLPIEQARQLITQKTATKSTKNTDVEGFLRMRYDCDARLHREFAARGGKITRQNPVYMMLGDHPPWATAYENPAMIKIPLAEIDPMTVSFTYGDSFVVLNPGKFESEEYWGKVYFRDEILELINRIGYPPQVEYDFKDENYAKYTPAADHLLYVEAHVWCDDLLDRYK